MTGGESIELLINCLSAGLILGGVVSLVNAWLP